MGLGTMTKCPRCDSVAHIEHETAQVYGPHPYYLVCDQCGLRVEGEHVVRYSYKGAVVY